MNEPANNSVGTKLPPAVAVPTFKSLVKTSLGTKIPFAGKEYEVFSSPRQMVTTIRQANQDYVESTNMFDENKEIVDQELARLIGLMPQEGEVLAGGSLFNVPQLGPTGAISNFKMDPNE